MSLLKFCLLSNFLNMFTTSCLKSWSSNPTAWIIYGPVFIVIVLLLIFSHWFYLLVFLIFLNLTLDIGILNCRHNLRLWTVSFQQKGILCFWQVLNTGVDHHSMSSHWADWEVWSLFAAPVLGYSPLDIPSGHLWCLTGLYSVSWAQNDAFLSSQPCKISGSFAQFLSLWATVYQWRDALRGKATFSSISVLSFCSRSWASLPLVLWGLLYGAFKQVFSIFFSNVYS